MGPLDGRRRRFRLILHFLHLSFDLHLNYNKLAILVILLSQHETTTRKTRKQTNPNRKKKLLGTLRTTQKKKRTLASLLTHRTQLGN